MKYDFDEKIERRHTNAMNTDGFRSYIFHADESMKFPYADDEFVRMWVADMEFATAPCVVEGIRKRADQRIFGYTKIFDPEYYEAFAGWCKKLYDWTPDKKDLVTSNGIIPALYEFVDYITRSDEKILITTPSYVYFKTAGDFHGRETVCSDLLDDDGYYTIDYDDFEKKAADPKVTLCLFCNPHNPSGRVWTEEELTKVYQICKNNDVFLVSDEIHCDLIRTGIRHIPMARIIEKLNPEYTRYATCMAPSKTFNLAGLMISNIIIRDPAVMARWNERHYSFDNPLSVAAAQAAYEDGGEWLEELKTYLDGNFAFTKEYLQKNLPQAVFRIPEATYLAWVDIEAYMDKIDDETLPLFFANKAGVLLEGGNMFVQNSDTFIRLNLAMPRNILETGLERICAALNTQASDKPDESREVA